MMEILKVNMQNGNMFGEQSSLSPIEKWLDNICPVVKQNDFDTCRSSYDDGNYDTCNGYRQTYNTYLDQFENC